MTEITSRTDAQRQWVDGIIDWCRASLQELSYSVQDWIKWNQIIKEASDSNWCRGQGTVTTVMMMRKWRQDK